MPFAPSARLIPAAAVLLGLTTGCNRDPEYGDAVVDDGPPTWNDVAPVLEQRCVHCHQDEAVGPMRLQTYDQVVPFGDLVRTSVVDRTMPPWLATDDGSCNSFIDSEYLSDEEVALIADWVDAGMLQGEDELIEISGREPVRLANPTHSLYPPEPYQPGADGLSDDWRCFVLEPGTTQDTFLTSWEVVPGEVSIAHHATIFVPPNEQTGAQVRLKDEAAEGIGYPCFGDAGVNASLGAIWSPGRDVYTLPDGVGIRIPAGVPLVMQMHYALPDDEIYFDQSVINIRLEEEIDKELHPFVLMYDSFEIPPGEEDYSSTGSLNLGDHLRTLTGQDYEGEIELIGTGSHMHLMGNSQYAEAVSSDGERQCIVDVPNWDYEWHNLYFYEEPIRLHTDDQIELTCSWNTMDQTEPVVWGDDLSDEMCAALIPAVFVDE